MKKFFLFLVIAIFVIIGCSNTKTTDLNQEVAKQNADKAETAISSADFESAEVKVPILIYHHIREASTSDPEENKQFIVSPENLDKQLQYLKKNGFATMSLKNLADYFGGGFSLPDKPIIITFDDGLISQYVNALPLLQKYGFTATFYIFTNPIGRSKNYMSWEQIKSLDDLGMEIGSHGTYHLFLNKIGINELEKEVSTSKKTIEEYLNKDITAFAYPFGAYNEQSVEAVKNFGYRSARNIINGNKHLKKDLYNLKGYFVTDDFSRFKNIVER